MSVSIEFNDMNMVSFRRSGHLPRPFAAAASMPEEAACSSEAPAN